MAYNPFNIFRRNQKALFAVLTVFIMVMFTISSGVAGGDFFETFGRWLGNTRGEVVCKIDGRKITSTELEQGPRSLQFRRLMANRFMYQAAFETVGNLRDFTVQQREKLSPAGRAMADEVQRALQGDPQDQLFAKFDPSGYERKREPEMARAFQSTVYVMETPGFKDEDRAVARADQAMLNLSRRLSEAPRDFYFVNAPNKTRRDLIEFMLWEKKADQLGIRFGRDDVKRLIQQEFSDSFSAQADVRVRKHLQEMQGFTIEACLDALASEFRVRAAQVAVLGYSARFHDTPVFSTPYEAFEYYREQCSPTSYEVLSVPAAAWLDKVPGEPSATELKELYDKYANEEPNPKNETPGFKTPRKIAVGYLGLTGEEPYYTKLAEEEIKVGEVMAKMSGALTVPVPGVGGLWVAGVAGPLSLKEPAVDAAYSAKVKEFDVDRARGYSRANIVVRDLLPTSEVRPGVAAATLGGMIGQTAGFGNPVAATMIAMGAPIGYEIRDRVKVGMPLVLGGIPGPALLPTAIAGTVAATASEPKALPIEALRPELLKETISKRAKVIAFGWQRDRLNPQPEPKDAEKGDVANFIEELKKLSNEGRPKDKAAVEKYIKEFIASRGLTNFGGSTEARDEWSLEDDPKLAPLVTAQQMSLFLANTQHGSEYMPFGRSFFWKDDFDFNTMGRRRTATPTGLYLAEKYPPQEPEMRPGQVHYVIWHTEDRAPSKNDRLAALDAVKTAWKRIKARELALKEANAIADKVRASTAANDVALEGLLTDLYYNDVLREAKDPKVIMRIKKFKIDNVAPEVMRPGQFGMPQLGAFGLAPSNDIPYPTAEMATALVENRDKGFKTVLVLPDAPKDMYYVAVLMKRDLKTPDEFRREVMSSFGQSREVLELYRREAMKRTRDSVLDLLKKEFKYEETEDQKKKLDENTKSGGRNDE